MKKSKFLTLSLGAALLLASACTDLDEELFDQFEGSTFFTTEGEIAQGLASVYRAQNEIAGSILGLQTLSTDELFIPIRGGDWDDGGIPLATHQHTWTVEHPPANNTWVDLYRFVARSNSLIETIESLGDLNASQLDGLAQAKTLRAYAYWQLLDLFQTPPLVTDAQIDPNNLPTNSTPEALFSFVESELLEAIPNLAPSADARGTIDQDAARAVLTNLYLNAETYLGTPRWEDAIAQADAIINSGQFTLVTDGLPNNYSGDNETSTENIWVVPENVPGTGTQNSMNFARRTIHYNQGESMNTPGGGWNGWATLASFYDRYEDVDARKAAWFLEGQQFDADGVTPLENRQGRPLIFTREISAPRLTGDDIETAGVRWNKYDPRTATPVGNEHAIDFVVFGLAEIMLAKAEAHIRLGQVGEAAALINPIRERAGVDPIPNPTLDDVYNERGRELILGGKRRPDMIRHGRFTTETWEFKEVTDPNRRFFFIPQQQLDANPNLTQNQ
ncbi:RagB/SusD family nutrient uptake outer membrane protein [Flavobacteriaceae bacterium GF1]